MKKPKWDFTIHFYKGFEWKPNFHYYIDEFPIWKDKYNTPRVEILPYISLAWLNFWIYIRKGSEVDWEWYLWVKHYNSEDLEQAKNTYPWGYYGENGEFIRNPVWENYNK